MGIYVCFDDSSKDPTFTNADNAYLVDSSYEDGNPCVDDNVNKKVSLIPSSYDDIKIFASIMGWNVETDNDGQVILYTGVQR